MISAHAMTSAPPLLGAHYALGAAHFRVWAPNASRVDVIAEAPLRKRIELRKSADGYFGGSDAGLSPGTLYKYEVDGEGPWPDPCSRFQPQGPHGPSLLTADDYSWHDARWGGLELRGQVLYELHVGTFTAAGTFDAAVEKLPHLAALGITVIELLPIAECPGRFNWGYDGVQLWAPYHVYGEPDSFKRFVDGAHAVGIGVILDVVYNHLGPDGNYLKKFSPYYFSTRYQTDWGEALNFDGDQAHGARDFVIENASYWMREFHLDGFRLDATQSIFDDTRPHILAETIQRARDVAAPRNIIVIAENEPQRGEHLLSPARGGYGLDGMWNDDFHHSARVALTGNRDGYFQDYTGRAQELLSATRRGFLYQGQYYAWQKQPRGSPLRHQPPWRCVHFIQNHDQVGNTFIGHRLHQFSPPSRYRAITALLLLGPQTPLLFMGQEFLSSRRFEYFADHNPQLRELVHAGRRKFLRQFASYAGADSQAHIPDPSADAAFNESKLDWSEAQTHAAALSMHTELLRLRREDPVISQQRGEMIDGATLSEHAFVLRWFDDRHGDRLLVVNLDSQLMPASFAEPLVAPPLHQTWVVVWSSDDLQYGGTGVVEPVSLKGGWRVRANSAVLLRAHPLDGELQQ
jgi:maltooligosyltrehalose trehalohydrolase